MWVLSTMLKAVTVTLVMVLAALNEVKVPLLRVSQAGGPGHSAWETRNNGTFTSFRAASTITNVTVTAFNIVDSTHITLALSYQGTGNTPAATIVVAAPGLSGSNTISAGWSSPTTVSVHLIGSGSLSSTTTCLRVLVVPFTGA